MNRILIILLCFAVSGCVSHPVSSAVSQRDEATRIAKGEIERRHIRLPSDCEITVADGVRNVELQELREEYSVRFTFMRDGKRDVVYEVQVNKRSGRVDGFLDYRDTTLGGR
jgi:hypothetical protein